MSIKNAADVDVSKLKKSKLRKVAEQLQDDLKKVRERSAKKIEEIGKLNEKLSPLEASVTRNRNRFKQAMQTIEEQDAVLQALQRTSRELEEKAERLGMNAHELQTALSNCKVVESERDELRKLVEDQNKEMTSYISELAVAEGKAIGSQQTAVAVAKELSAQFVVAALPNISEVLSGKDSPGK